MRTVLVIAVSIVCLCLYGCYEETKQLQRLPLVVEGDELAKARIEEILIENPKIFIRSSSFTDTGQETEYAIQLVKPDSSKNYSILRVKPDTNTEYRMMIIDPKTQKPPANIDPKALKAIIDQVKKHKQNDKDK